MRRFITLIAALFMAASLAACGAQASGQTASET